MASSLSGDIDPGGSDDDPAFAAFVAADSDDEAAVPALSTVSTAARETTLRSSPAAVLAPTGRRGRERPASARKRRDAPATAPAPAPVPTPGGKAAPSVPAPAVPEVS